jgi:hypothetical protein
MSFQTADEIKGREVLPTGIKPLDALLDGSLASTGLLILSIVIPLVFLLALGTALVSDIFFLGQSTAEIGFMVFLAVMAVFIFYILWTTRKSQ